MKPEHHLGKAEPRLPGRNAIACRQRQFEAAAQAEAMDQRHRGEGQTLQPVEHRQALADSLGDDLLVDHVGEFADLGPGDEA